ncbi:FAD-dependent oxidoreductase [Synechococcus sp. M16CYN]|uniref:NAD(P)/FAD-dependent oxidoreductase n=1 Tax=Synechococcus sp. M16CYN TaxID=3103139 RepID=UPI0032568B17
MTDFIDSDVLIIGGGPAGCACALYTARSSITTQILDKNPSVGALAITHQIANYPGVTATTSGSALLQLMREQAISYGAKYKQAQVYGIDLHSDRKIVYTPEGIFRSRILVLATGAMGRASTLPGENEFLGRGVSYCATCDSAFYKQQEVAVYGFNQEAIDEALVLIKSSSRVHWITKSKPKSSSTGMHILTTAPNVQWWQYTQLIKIEGDESGVKQIKLRETRKLNMETVNVNGVFIYSTGSMPIIEYLNGQVPLNTKGGIKVDDNMKTDIDGVWAIGDIRNTPFKQAVVACSDGCIAAMSIDKYLNQRKEIRVDWVHR